MSATCSSVSTSGICSIMMYLSQNKRTSPEGEVQSVPPGTECLEADVCGQTSRTLDAREVTPAALVDRRHIVFVEQVVDVKLQIHILAHTIGCHCIIDP